LHDTVFFAFKGEEPDMKGLMFGLIRFLDSDNDRFGIKRLFGYKNKWKVKEHYTNNNGLTVLERV